MNSTFHSVEDYHAAYLNGQRPTVLMARILKGIPAIELTLTLTLTLTLIES